MAYTITLKHFYFKSRSNTRFRVVIVSYKDVTVFDYNMLVSLLAQLVSGST